jgi:hypothetical protein
VSKRRPRGAIVLTGRCDTGGCQVQTVEIFAKEHGERLPDRLRCPACGQALIGLNSVSLAKHERQEALDARGLVAVDMYLRDQRGNRPRGVDSRWLTMYPVSVLCDKRLPPTPPGWWNQCAASREPTEPERPE